MAAAVEPHPRPLGPIPRRVPFGHTRAWRVVSFLVGVVGPALLWGSIGIGTFFSHPESGVKGSFGHKAVLLGALLFAFADLLCLAYWLVVGTRSGRAQRVFALVFLAGALFAAVGSLLSLVGLAALFSHPERGWLGRGVALLMTLTPLGCVLVYAVNASVAWGRRRTRTGSEPAEREGWGSEAQDRAPK